MKSIIFFLILSVPLAFAEPISTGGAELTHPVGRYLDNESPQFFSWKLRQPADTIQLVIYQKSSNEDKVVASFDFLGTTENFKWSQKELTKGKYYWEVSTFSSKNPKPITQDRSYFSIEDIEKLNLRSLRVGAFAAFGRGDYATSDDTYDLSYQTTPTNYGFMAGGGTENWIYETSFMLSDYTIDGTVLSSEIFHLDADYHIAGSGPYSFELFLGPRLRYLSVPITRSSDGTSTFSEKTDFILAGLSLKIQRQINNQTSVNATAFIDSSVNTDNFSDPLSYGAQIGWLYNLAWPIGIGVDVQWVNNQLMTDIENEDVTLTDSRWSAVGKIIYNF